MLKNIFSNQESITKPFNLISETESDIDCNRAMIECLTLIETEYFNIAKEHMMSNHIGYKENNVEILQESLSDMARNAVEFFKKVIKHITEFFKKSFTYISSYFGDFEKFINKYKDLILKSDPEFEIHGYNYTFNPKYPDESEIDNIISRYNSEISRIKDMEYKDITELKDNEWNDEVKNKLRAKVIGKTGEITAENYLEEVKRSYRGDKDKPDNIKVDTEYVQNIISTYSSIKKCLSDTKKDYDNIVKNLNIMKRFFESGVKVQYVGNDKMINHSNSMSYTDKKITRTGDSTDEQYSTDLLKKYDTYYNFRFEQSKVLSAILTNAFYEKVNALKEQLKMYEKVIRRCLGSKKSDEKDGDK